MKTFKVGGAIRDRLLGLEPNTDDYVVVGATVDEMLAQGFRPVGRDFPVFLHPETGDEYALARTERKSGPGYRGFVVHAAPDVTLADDLARRDLTVNAIAEDADGTLVDPHGGRADLEAKLLRHVSPAFVEDPVRILRAARFAARFHGLGFRVAPETTALMRDMVAAGEADALVPERVWQETLRALRTDHPQVFFEVLRACGALARVFPEVDRLFGVPQPPKHHPEVDTGIHTMMVLAQAARLTSDEQVRFAALVHDLGKGTTPADQLPKHHGHEQRGVALVRKLAQRLKVPRDFAALGEQVSRYHLHCHRAHELRADTIVELLEALDAFRRPNRFDQFLLACEADARGRTGLEERDYPQPELLRGALRAAAAVDVAPLMEQGLAGAELGAALRAARVSAVAAIGS
ncbi:MAG: multifunctional CCA addition/repair protein [Xanthomonadaceae bacterium]|nr:multifunctional CCA addition/repair protein [Xanthomonadaceae bacterium]